MMNMMRGLKKLCKEVNVKFKDLQPYSCAGLSAYKFEDSDSNHTYYLVSLKESHRGIWGITRDISTARYCLTGGQ